MKYKSRLAATERRRTTKTVVSSIITVFFLGGLLFYFGIPMLIKLAVFMADLNGKPESISVSQTTLSAPVLDALPESTPSASLLISGYAPSQSKVVVILNGDESASTLANNDGRFELKINLSDGENIISAQAVSQDEQKSPVSKLWTVVKDSSPPELSLTNTENTRKSGSGEKIYTAGGKTEPSVKITVNGHFAQVNSDGNFSFKIDLHEGDNSIEVIATDRAGNQTLAQLTVNWQP